MDLRQNNRLPDIGLVNLMQNIFYISVIDDFNTDNHNSGNAGIGQMVNLREDAEAEKCGAIIVQDCAWINSAFVKSTLSHTIQPKCIVNE